MNIYIIRILQLQQLQTVDYRTCSEKQNKKEGNSNMPYCCSLFCGSTVEVGSKVKKIYMGAVRVHKTSQARRGMLRTKQADRRRNNKDKKVREHHPRKVFRYQDHFHTSRGGEGRGSSVNNRRNHFIPRQCCSPKLPFSRDFFFLLLLQVEKRICFGQNAALSATEK